MDLSILLPARNEEFLQNTIDDILLHAEGNTEVLVALDNWDNPPEVKKHPRVRVVRTKKGQRGATNELAKLSEAKYVMKLDAHVSVSQGFDVAMMQDMEEDVTMVLGTCNLHAYDWVCPEGHRHFQGKYDECEQCGSKDLRKELVWQVIPKPIRSSFYFDTNLHFQFQLLDNPEIIHESMSIQGSGFMATREKYWELGLCDEAMPSWGSQGTEIACKTWLSGGRVLSTKKAYYGHQFRETEGFPYHNPVEEIFRARDYVQDMFLNNKWPKQTRPLSWLVEKFAPLPDWHEESGKAVLERVTKAGLVFLSSKSVT